MAQVDSPMTGHDEPVIQSGKPFDLLTTKTNALLELPQSQFDSFRTQLDEHYDRREKVIKASRDITASSKKIIFALQRVRRVGVPIPSSTSQSKDFLQHLITIQDRFASIVPELQGLNAHRYQHQISPGIQEYVEAILFWYYLETQTLLPFEKCAERIPEGVLLTEQDYILGLFDTTGELMRHAITQLATREESMNQSQTSGGHPQILTDLQALRRHLQRLDVGGSFGLRKQMDQKMGTLRQSVEKVENAVYSITVRGKERPKGWNPGLEGTVEVGVES